MTGFGRARCETSLGQFSIEIKTVNHRYNNISLKLPPNFSFLEPRLQECLKEQIQRGQVYFTLDYIPGDSVPTANVRLDKSLAAEYWRSLSVLQQQLGLSETLGVEALIQLPGVLTVRETLPDEDLMWESLTPTLDEALHGLQAMRLREGESIRNSLRGILSKIRECLVRVHEINDEQLPMLRKKLLARMQELLEEVGEADETRLMMEVGLLADKADVTEEISRLGSHCEQFEQALDTDGPIGRQLDFLLQEMNREANTIASKNRDQEAASVGVHLKVEVEKMRELVQNVE